ncbi:MAG: DsrE/DsrF/DrsH-like family protein [Thermaerobacter sp.]|nr:DsrE/DsrF/DrsH-like family protein [Thermaerobacter sp.]
MSVERMSVILASGDADKLLPVGVLASGAAAMQLDVEIFLTMWGVLAFRKGAIGDMPVSATFKEREAEFKDLLVRHKVPNLIEMLETAKEIGNVRVVACGMTLDLFGLKREDLEDVVDGVAGVGEFIESAKEGKLTLFI